MVGQADMTPSDKKNETNDVITGALNVFKRERLGFWPVLMSFSYVQIGDLLIIMAQVITACQMVYEEKYVVDKDIPPLQAVGWEG